jgi:uncharacterized membrane protein
MTSGSPWRALWIVVGIAAVLAVIGGAYYWGMNSGHGGFGFVGPRRGFGMMGWGGVGWWGLIPALILVFLFVFLLVTLISGQDRGPRTAGPGSPTTGGDVERLRELSELHERGRLTDEEFAAAKRKLLGL